MNQDELNNVSIGATFDITLLIDKKKHFTIVKFEEACSVYFQKKIIIGNRYQFSDKSYLDKQSLLIINSYSDEGDSFKNFTISFTNFQFNQKYLKEQLNEFFEMIDQIASLIEFDIAICSYIMNFNLLDGLCSLNAVMANVNKFPIVFFNKKYNLSTDFDLINTSVKLNPKEQQLY